MKQIAAVLLLAILLFGCSDQRKQGPQNPFVLGEDLTAPQSFGAEQKNETTNPFDKILGNHSTALPNVSLFIITDKPSYHSSEKLNISARLESDSEIPGVRVRIHGLANILGREVFDQNQLFYVKPGGYYWANFTHQLAYCAKCTGFPAGTYWLHASAVDEGTNRTLAETNSSIYFSP